MTKVSAGQIRLLAPDEIHHARNFEKLAEIHGIGWLQKSFH